MKRRDLKPGDIFEFVDFSMEPKIVDTKNHTISNSSSQLSARMDDEVVLLGKDGKFFPQNKEPPNAAEALQPHWRGLNPEPVTVIEAWGYDKNWYRANAIKYVARAGKKVGVSARDDLLKALSFIIREITALDGAPSWILEQKEKAGAKTK